MNETQKKAVQEQIAFKDNDVKVRKQHIDSLRIQMEGKERELKKIEAELEELRAGIQ